MDRGPWRVMYDAKDRAVGVRSDDFEHDVILTINGDFAGDAQRQAYAEFVRDRLNAPLPTGDRSE